MTALGLAGTPCPVGFVRDIVQRLHTPRFEAGVARFETDENGREMLRFRYGGAEGPALPRDEALKLLRKAALEMSEEARRHRILRRLDPPTALALLMRRVIRAAREAARP